jgi:hypothetical protein
MFIKTIETFVKYCNNLDVINKIILFDDSSSLDDRILMLKTIEKNFNNIELSVEFYHKNLFDEFRHSRIMQKWYNRIQTYNFCFHLEDDWECVDTFNLVDDIKFLMKNNDIFGINYSWDKFTYYPPNFNKDENEKYWKWPYNKIMYDNNTWFTPYPDKDDNFILQVYPPFGFRPTLYDVSKLKNIEVKCVKNFETDMGLQFSENLKLYLTNHKKFTHIGDNISSYDLNKSVR